MLEFALSVFFVVIISVVYTEILTAPGMILDFWSRFLHNHIKKEWILKPLIDCVYCFGGQLALWYGFIWNDYKLLTHFLFIVTVIFFIHIYKLWTSNT
jgi:hypothetical protein